MLVREDRRVLHGRQVEGARLLIDFDQKEHLKKNITQFFADRFRTTGANGFGQLVNLLDKVVDQ